MLAPLVAGVTARMGGLRGRVVNLQEKLQILENRQKPKDLRTKRLPAEEPWDKGEVGQGPRGPVLGLDQHRKLHPKVVLNVGGQRHEVRWRRRKETSATCKL